MAPTPNTAGPVAAVPTPAMPILPARVALLFSDRVRVAAVLTVLHGRRDGAALMAHIQPVAVGRLTLGRLAVLELRGLVRAETAAAAVLGVIPRVWRVARVDCPAAAAAGAVLKRAKPLGLRADWAVAGK